VIVAIDGPAGAGKSTVARALAGRLGIGYLNTGSMYRALALLAVEHGIDPSDGPGLAAVARTHPIRMRHTADGERVTVDGRDVTDAVRDRGITRIVSQVAVHAQVRAEIVATQRAVLATGSWVADGRDIGSVVCPDAELKVFLTATPEERAGRRHSELVAGGEDVDLGDVMQEIAARDHVDSTRQESPLVVASGAVTLDTTGMTIDDVVDRLVELAGGVA
jgi:cytidylate kinase